MFLYCYGQAGESKRRHRPVGAHQVVERDILEGSANRHIDALPCPSDAADSLVLAITINRAALGYGYRALKRIDDVSRTDVLWAP